MCKYCLRLILVIHICLFASFSFAAVLHWSPVESSDECIIAGYEVNYGTISGEYTQVVDVGNVTLCDLDLLSLVPTVITSSVPQVCLIHRQLFGRIRHTDSL